MTYPIYTLADALKPRPRLDYLVESILPQGSISIWYGYPGSLKSNLVMDMAVAIATGKPWLPSMPRAAQTFGGYTTVQTPVLWIDIDNGMDVTAERLAAFASTYNADPGTPLFWMSYPTPVIQASNWKSMGLLQTFIAGLPIQPKFIVLDTLLRVARVKDENASEMDTVMNNIHKLAEDLKATLVMISHSRKENTGRAGNGLRGHSSIEGGVDAVFFVKREENSDKIEIENQKVRRKPVDPFTARWTYFIDPINNQLSEARFYHEQTVKMSKQDATILNLCQRIVLTLKSNGAMNTSELFAQIGGHRQNFAAALEKVLDDGTVTSRRANTNNSVIYESK